MNDLFTKAMATDNTPPLTIETMMEAIDALKQKPIFFEGHPFHEVFEVKECAALKGSQMVIISGETLHYWPDAFDANEVKVLKLPKLPEPELTINWEI